MGHQLLYVEHRIHDTYHFHVINYDRIDMWATILVGDLAGTMCHMRNQPEFFYSLHNTSRVSQGINKKNCALIKRLHLRECCVEVAWADLGGDGKEEFAPSRHLAFDPHIPLHQ